MRTSRKGRNSARGGSLLSSLDEHTTGRSGRKYGGTEETDEAAEEQYSGGE